MAESLAVWLYGFQAAVIEQQRGRLRLTYTPEALNRYPLGFPLLSMALPLAPKRYSHGVVSAFIDGLLPEGDQRRVIADDLDLKAGDTYSLIRCLGRDCAGALIVLPSDQMPPPPATVDTAIPLTESELGDMVTNLRHERLIGDCVVAVERSHRSLTEKMPHEVLLLDLYAGLKLLNALTGETTVEDILSNIFASFCIGK